MATENKTDKQPADPDADIRAQRIAAAKAKYRALLSNTSAEVSPPVSAGQEADRRLSEDRPPHWEETLIKRKR